MGPVALFDKSFLQSLGDDESVWFDHFFLANVCPIFYAETQADLAKEERKGVSPEALVARIAEKFPDFSGSPNVHHRTMCTASLMGHDVPLRGQLILPAGCQAAVSGQAMAVLPVSAEAKAFLRWVQGQFAEEERQAAAEWRRTAHGFETAEVIETLTRVKAYQDVPCPTLPAVQTATDEALASVTEQQKLWLVLQLLGVFREYYEPILKRWQDAGKPPLATFAPYAAFILRIELFYHIAAHKGRMGAAQRLDMTYLFYLPFCDVFVSSDWVHRDCAPLFLREDQDFVWGLDLKESLRQINAHYAGLRQDEQNKSIHELAPGPPLDENNLVTKLWDRHWPRWRAPRKSTPEQLRKVTAWWQAQLKEIEQSLQSPATSQPLPTAELDAIVMQRKARKKRGSWWRVPAELRRPQLEPAVRGQDEAIAYRNGAEPENVVDREISVYLQDGKPEISSLPQCQTFRKDKLLYVDCAPKLNRKYTAPVPPGAMIAFDRSGRELALFVDPDSDLGRLVLRLFEMQEKRRKKEQG